MGGTKKRTQKRTRRRGRRATPTNNWDKRKRRQHKRNTQKTHNGEREHGGEKHETHEISQGQIAETTNNTSRRNKIKESERERESYTHEAQRDGTHTNTQKAKLRTNSATHRTKHINAMRRATLRRVAAPRRHRILHRTSPHPPCKETSIGQSYG